LSCSAAPVPESLVERPLTAEQPGDVLQKLQLEAIGMGFQIAQEYKYNHRIFFYTNT